MKSEEVYVEDGGVAQVWRKLTSKLDLPASPISFSPCSPSHPNLSSLESSWETCYCYLFRLLSTSLYFVSSIPLDNPVVRFSRDRPSPLPSWPLLPLFPSASCAHNGQQHGNRYCAVTRTAQPLAHKRPRLHTHLGWLDREFDDVQAISGGGRAATVRSGGFLCWIALAGSELMIFCISGTRGIARGVECSASGM